MYIDERSEVTAKREGRDRMEGWREGRKEGGREGIPRRVAVTWENGGDIAWRGPKFRRRKKKKKLKKQAACRGNTNGIAAVATATTAPARQPQQNL